MARRRGPSGGLAPNKHIRSMQRHPPDGALATHKRSALAPPDGPGGSAKKFKNSFIRSYE